MELVDILKAAVAARASDIILAAKHPPVIRIHGSLTRFQDSQPTDAAECQRWIYSMFDEKHKAAFERDRDVDFSYSLPDVGRFRVNVFQQAHGIAAALRLIPTMIPSIEELDLGPAVLSLSRLPRGLVLVTGPTGSGKTSTLAALIDTINDTQSKHILTIEDPIEYTYINKASTINQREIGTHTDSFSKALKYALRQNPDIIMVGEMRDVETTALALSAAETGHLCFSTLHTQDAASTVNRIIDEFPAEQHLKVRNQLGSLLAAVVSQVLLPKKTGGRVCAREILIMTPAVATMIRDDKISQLYGVIESSAGLGMISMDQSIAKLVRSGVVDIEHAVGKARDPQSLRKLVGAPTGPPGPVTAR